MNVVIVDYGAGNLKSVANAIAKIKNDENLDLQLKISDKKEDLNLADKIILPGVGAYGDCMAGLKQKDLILELNTQIIKNKKKFLGVCVGMQVLSEVGYEDGTNLGLGFIKGNVQKINDFNQTLKIPHMGWNEVEFVFDHEILLNNIQKKEHFYFANSYHFIAQDKKDILGFCNYEQIINAAILKDNILGLQFHPEKSGEAGLQILSNFLSW